MHSNTFQSQTQPQSQSQSQSVPFNGNATRSQSMPGLHHQYHYQQQIQSQSQQQRVSRQSSQTQKYSYTKSKSVIERGSRMNKYGIPIIEYLVSGTKFTVHSKYKLLRAIGHGAYGFVCSAQNNQTNEYVAIKKIANLFNNPIETKRAIREVQLLRKLRHENILGLTDLMMNDVKSFYIYLYHFFFCFNIIQNVLYFFRRERICI